MATIWTIVQFVIVFGILIFVHELGHYLTALFLGIPVAEFGFGYPPKLVRLFRWKGTDFTLNAIPFGGFVRFQDDIEKESEETADTNTKPAKSGIVDGITNAPKWKRFLVAVAGPVMNFILGIILLVVMFNALGNPDPSRVEIIDIAPHSPAEQVGLQKGDIFVSVGGVKIDSSDRLSAQIQANLEKEVEIVVARKNDQVSTKLTPRENPPEGQGAIGIIMGHPSIPARFGDTVKNAFATFWNQVKTTLTLPIKLIQGVIQPKEARLVGIKGIYDLFSQAEATDQATGSAAPITRLALVSMISIALGIGNLLPIPALDGGQILFVLIEAVTRKKMNEKVVNIINTVFFFLLILLMVYITFQDFINPIRIP